MRNALVLCLLAACVDSGSGPSPSTSPGAGGKADGPGDALEQQFESAHCQGTPLTGADLVARVASGSVDLGRYQLIARRRECTSDYYPGGPDTHCSIWEYVSASGYDAWKGLDPADDVWTGHAAIENTGTSAELRLHGDSFNGCHFLEPYDPAYAGTRCAAPTSDATTLACSMYSAVRPIDFESDPPQCTVEPIDLTTSADPTGGGKTATVTAIVTDGCFELHATAKTYTHSYFGWEEDEMVAVPAQ